MKFPLVLVSCLFLFLSFVVSLNKNGVVLTSAAAAADGFSDSNLVVTQTGGRSLLSLPQQEDAAEIVARQNGTIYLQNKLSGKVLWSFSTGDALYSSYQVPEPNQQYEDENYADGPLTDFFVDVGDDWKPYARVRKSSSKIQVNIEDFIKMTPLLLEDRTAILGSKETSAFEIDAMTGKLIGSYHSRSSSKSETDGGEGNLDEDTSQSVSTATSVIHIRRTDYALKSFSPYTNGEFWNMTVSTLEADFFCKPSVDPMSTMNPSIDVDLGLNTILSCEHRKMVVRRLDKPHSSPQAIEGDEKLPLHSSNLQHPLQLRHEGSKHFHGQMTLGRSTDNAALPAGIKGESISNSHLKGDIVSSVGSVAASKHQIRLNPIDVLSTVKSPLVFLFFSVLVFVCLAFAFYYQDGVVKVRALVGLSDHNSAKSTHSERKKSQKSGKTGRKDLEMPFENSTDDAVTEDDNVALLNLNKLVDDGSGHQIGKLLVSDREIAMGSNGTVVLEGVYDGRPVAVKRLVRAHHDLAFKEIQNLIASDRHPNIVRWYGVEYDKDFVYVALERCACNLDDMIQIYAASSLKTGFIIDQVTKTPVKDQLELDSIKVMTGDLSLWKANGKPSSQLLKLMRDVVSGLAHLHQLGIIHRDLKPQNVLITKETHLCAKLSDMGISKRLLGDMSSLGHHTAGCGSSGWQAPEQLLHGRQTRAVDMFSLGCVLFYCITGGNHPFGDRLERDVNIVKNQVDFFLLAYFPEAQDLIFRLLNPDPVLRPSVLEVLNHPMFWSSDMRLSFLRDTSDRVELENRGSNCYLLKALEVTAHKALGCKWNEKMERAFIANIGHYRRYRFDSVRDLLRVMRNKLNHYRELPNEVQQLLGPVPEGYDDYFSSRFPNLLIEVYNVVLRYCKQEDFFQKYISGKLL